MPSAGLVLALLSAALHWQTQKRQRASGSPAAASSALSIAGSDAVCTRFSPLPFDIRFAVAPMVAQSDLAFRMLTRRYGATVVYTPMLYAERFVNDAAYRNEVIDFDPTNNGTGLSAAAADRPLIVQFAANDAATLVEAALLVQQYGVDAVDINLGCPQDRAKEGHYGSFLLGRRDWPRVRDMVRACHAALNIPVTCKIRLLDSFEDTLAFCRMLQDAGCAMIAVHARKRGSDKRRRVGPADLSQIARLRPLLRIPLIANGNIRSFADAQTNLATTGVEGVMSAEAILACPRLFSPDANLRQVSCTEMAREYLHFCSLYPPPPLHWMADHVHNIVRAHIEKNRWMDLRAGLKTVGRERPHAEGLGAPPVAVAAAIADDAGVTVQQAAAHAQEYAQGVATMEAVLVELEQRLVLLQRQGGPDAARALAKQQRAQQREAAAKEDNEAVGSLWFADAAVPSVV